MPEPHDAGKDRNPVNERSLDTGGWVRYPSACPTVHPKSKNSGPRSWMSFSNVVRKPARLKIIIITSPSLDLRRAPPPPKKKSQMVHDSRVL